MPDLITLTGVVATPPRHITTNAGLDITSFRLASSQRRFDREQKRWVEAETNWYTVTAFRQLAANAAVSVERGQHVVVTGRLRVRAWENAEKSGTTVELEADAVGHDLSWGTSVHTRSVLARPAEGATGAADGMAERWSGGALPAGDLFSGESAGPADGGPDGGGGAGADTHDVTASQEAGDLVPF
jgi:single-strand DNA-binding protein